MILHFRYFVIPGLIDKNVQEINEQYRAAEGLVSIDDIEKLMKIYKIGKAPLSLALGFGEVTIPRYLEGQVPSKEYSDIILYSDKPEIRHRYRGRSADIYP